MKAWEDQAMNIVMNAVLKRLFLTIAMVGIGSAVWAAPLVVGKVELVRGEVEVQHPENALWATVSDDEPVFSGDRFRTGRKARLKLVMVDRSILFVGQRAEIDLSRYQVNQTGQVTDTHLNLILGQARIIVNKVRDPNAKYEIETPTAVAGVRGTDILSSVEDVQGTHVSTFGLLSGRLEVRGKGEHEASSVMIGANEFTMVGEHDAPLAARMMSPEMFDQFREEIEIGHDRDRRDEGGEIREGGEGYEHDEFEGGHGDDGEGGDRGGDRGGDHGDHHDDGGDSGKGKKGDHGDHEQGGDSHFERSHDSSDHAEQAHEDDEDRHELEELQKYGFDPD
ncbi:MAG: hypothetical protein COX57_00740 [Alphaproteobacteria bacterium CG_4_10_14_0_2_um_filter_63_37]|nr:MAG: hypothetical protein AUJ55_07230 [Proteobacteria bacterium CG1_02_64_396]PJA25956.1 MAG: hypothetical protein COX57_00740 [Alphaproteobacteria bacterium CG_4_10_14_0_2_um_filter_63_37]